MNPSSDWDQSDWIEFHDRVAEATNIARAAAANIATALVSLTAAIIGVAFMLITSDIRPGYSPRVVASLIAMAGAGFAALSLVIALATEAIRAAGLAKRVHDLYLRASTKQVSKDAVMPELRKAIFSVGIHWKVSVPLGILGLGLGGAVAVMLASSMC